MSIVWPSEVYRAAIADGLDAVRAAEADRDRWQEHAQLDHAALGRAWSCASSWAEVADRWPDDLGLAATGLHMPTLRACAAALRARIIDDPEQEATAAEALAIVKALLDPCDSVCADLGCTDDCCPTAPGGDTDD